MKRLTVRFLSLVALFLATACASGPDFSKIESTLPTLTDKTGRIYFFRDASPFGAALQPGIHLNGKLVGQSVPGGVFFEDVPPGNYEVTTETEVEKKLTFSIGARQERFVETTVGFGILVGRIYPSLVDPKDGRERIRTLSYTGAGATQ